MSLTITIDKVTNRIIPVGNPEGFKQLTIPVKLPGFRIPVISFDGAYDVSHVPQRVLPGVLIGNQVYGVALQQIAD